MVTYMAHQRAGIDTVDADDSMGPAYIHAAIKLARQLLGWAV